MSDKEQIVFRPADVCPNCGNRTDGKPPNICSPTRCDAWRVEAQFDHKTQQWVHPKIWERLQRVQVDEVAE